jgi:hypothetical protein
LPSALTLGVPSRGMVTRSCAVIGWRGVLGTVSAASGA